MPNFVDYSTQDMNGTPVHTFVDANGQAAPPMYGDQANALARSIDQYKQFQAANAGPDLRVAGPGGAPDASSQAPPNQTPWTTADGQAIPGNPALPASTAASPPQLPGAGGTNSEPNQSVNPGVPGANQSVASPEDIKRAAAGDLTAGAGDQAADQAFIRAPTAGTTRAQLQKRASQSVATPKTGEETIEQGAPYDQNAADERADANVDLRLAKQREAEMMQARADRDAGIWDQQAATAATRIQHEQAKQQLVQDGIDSDYSTYRDFRDQVAKQKVDPNRLFSGDAGAFRMIAAVIGQGLGAFAASGGGTDKFRNRGPQSQNFAKQIIDGAIDRDIRAQETDIKTQQEGASNQLNDIYKRIGDMNQAKTVLRSMQQDYAGMQMKSLAARDGSADAQNAFDQWDASNAADRAEQERKFLADSAGKHTIKVAQQYVQPGGGGAPSLQLQLQRARARAELGTLAGQPASQAAELGLKQSEAAKNNAEAAKSANGTDAGYNSGVEKVDTALDAARSLAAEYGYSIDPKTGKLAGDGSFTRDLVPGADTDATTAFKGKVRQLNALHAIAVTGSPRINPEAAEDMGIKVKTGGNGATEQQFNSVYQNLLRKKAELGASTNARSRAQRGAQQAQIGVENQATEEPEEL